MLKNYFIEKAKQKHGNIYDYSKVPDDFNSRSKICIICPKHGEFLQRADTHLEGKGCCRCGHDKTGLATRKTLDSDKNNIAKLSLPKFPIVENPKAPYNNYFIGTIYLFINHINNKVYVGQTYNNYITRWTEHRKTNEKYYLHIALNKYGWDNFSRFVIFQTDFYLKTEENKKIITDILDEKEKYYIQYFKSNDSNYGYNLTSGGREYDNLYETMKKTERHPFTKPVNQYDLDGNLIKTWESAALLNKTTEFKKDGVSDCCKGKRESYKGYIWKFVEIPKKEEKINTKNSAKPVLQYDLEGNFIKEYKSSQEVNKELGYSATNIRSCCRGIYNTCFNYVWIFKDGNIPNKLPDDIIKERGLDIRINQYNIDGTLVKSWLNMAEIKEAFNIQSTQSIAACIRGASKTSYGYIWKKESIFDNSNK